MFPSSYVVEVYSVASVAPAAAAEFSVSEPASSRRRHKLQSLSILLHPPISLLVSNSNYY